MRTLFDEWVSARKSHRCVLCDEAIPVGQIHRVWRGKDGGEFVDARYHAECMLVTDIDEWDAIDWEIPSDPADFRVRRQELRDEGKLGTQEAVRG